MQTSIDTFALVAEIPDAVVVSDAKGNIVLWNAGAERLFGFTEAEAMGQSLDIIIPERLRQRHWDGYWKSMESGTSRYGAGDMLRVPAIGKGGRNFSIAFTVAMLKGPDGAVQAIASVIRDDTQRFNDERALRKEVADLKAKVAAQG